VDAIGEPEVDTKIRVVSIIIHPNGDQTLDVDDGIGLADLALASANLQAYLAVQLQEDEDD
jgi:hypothetical protein